MAIVERAQRIEMQNQSGRIKIYSAVTSVDGYMPNENELIGNFNSAEQARKQISRNKKALNALFALHIPLEIGAFVFALSASIDELTHIGEDSWENAHLRFLSGLILFSINTLAAANVSRNAVKLTNTLAALEEAETSAGYPYRKVFPFGRRRQKFRNK